MEHQRRPECLGELAGLGVVEVGADLRQVRAVIGAGVEVDADVASADDLGHEQVGDPGRQRSVRRSGERAVEVAAVREVAVAVQEAVHVDDRDGDHGAGHRAGVEAAHHAPDDLDAVDLVAVDRGAEPHGVPVAASVPHLQGQRDPRAGHLAGDREFAGGRSARRHVELADPQRCASCTAHDRRRFLSRTAFGGRPPRYDTLGSTRNRPRRASRPISMRNPISSRRVRVISASTSWPAMDKGTRTTGR